jgi:quercetin dioxygenase-like cupin family protein
MGDDAGYTRLAEGDMEFRERRGGGPSSSDVAGALDAAEHLALRVWRYGPGHQMAFHRHRTQEEIYHLVSGGPQEVRIGDAIVTLEDGDWVRVGRDTPRRIENNSDREAVWVTLGVPRGEGITDGIRLDPETGREIPRT